MAFLRLLGLLIVCSILPACLFVFANTVRPISRECMLALGASLWASIVPIELIAGSAIAEMQRTARLFPASLTCGIAAAGAIFGGSFRAIEQASAAKSLSSAFAIGSATLETFLASAMGALTAAMVALPTYYLLRLAVIAASVVTGMPRRRWYGAEGAVVGFVAGLISAKVLTPDLSNLISVIGAIAGALVGLYRAPREVK
jgi:hypothetical protein